jgi:hypothetical protein
MTSVPSGQICRNPFSKASEITPIFSLHTAAVGQIFSLQQQDLVLAAGPLLA